MWLLLILVAAATFLLHHCLVTLRYWERRGVPHPRPLPIVGNFVQAFFGRTTFYALTNALIEPFKDKGYCGTFQFSTPLLLVWEPEMVKQILTKEFSSFHDRGLPFDAENDPLSAHLFNLEGDRWRRLRNKLSPTFTSGKLKLMFPLMRDVSLAMNDIVRADACDGGGEVDIKTLLTRFSTDVIGTCAFGIRCDSLKSGNDDVLQMARETTEASFAATCRFFLATIHPKLARIVPMKLLFSKATAFFLDLMKDTVEHREKSAAVDRKDFVSLMIQLRESDRAETNPENRIDFTNSLMTAQAFIFFIAGLDNIANTVSFCLHQLAHDPDLQRRAAEEVRTTVREHSGELSYEALQRMDLVERIAKEGLRMWNPIGFLQRVCNSKTQIGDLVVEKGQSVAIFSAAMHMDPNNFPEPNKFDPDRFTEEAKKSRHPYAYLPFGEGPRICIAERFALLEMKLALASVLREFQVLPSTKTGKVLELEASSFIPQPKNGFWLKIRARGNEESS